MELVHFAQMDVNDVRDHVHDHGHDLDYARDYGVHDNHDVLDFHDGPFGHADEHVDDVNASDLMKGYDYYFDLILN